MRSHSHRRSILGLLVFSIAVMFTAFLSGVVLAQATPQVDILHPGAWYASPDAVIAAGMLVGGYLVKLLTSFLKSAFLTSGSGTVVMSGIATVMIAGVGGYFALGYLAGSGGFAGALQAAAMALLAFLHANLSYIYDRNTAQKAVEKASSAKTKLLG